MKKGFFIVILLFIGGVIFSGCIKNTPYVTTTNPQMTATCGQYTFVASNVTTAILDTQIHDSITTLIITGNTSDRAHPYDKIQLSVTKFKNTTGVFSIVQEKANASFTHSGKVSYALGGVVTITSYTPQTIIGYFSFDTQDTLHIADGKFIANRP